MARRRTRTLAAAGAVLALCTACTGGGDAPEEPVRLAAAASGAATPSAEGPPRCSTATLSGRYLYEVHGDKRFAEGLYPYVEVGTETYDGAGRVTNTHTDSVTRKDSTQTGTYTLDATCRGTVTYASGLVHRVLVSPRGDEFTSYEAPSAVPQKHLDGGAVRVSADTAARCTSSSLLGTYSYRARGFYDRGLHIEHGFETFDGQGAVTNSYALDGDDTDYLTGTYEGSGDCQARITYADGGPTFVQYLSPDGEQFKWIQVDGFTEGDDGGLFAGHERRVSTSTDAALTTRPAS